MFATQLSWITLQKTEYNKEKHWAQIQRRVCGDWQLQALTFALPKVTDWHHLVMSVLQESYSSGSRRMSSDFTCTKREKQKEMFFHMDHERKGSAGGKTPPQSLLLVSQSLTLFPDQEAFFFFNSVPVAYFRTTQWKKVARCVRAAIYVFVLSFSEPLEGSQTSTLVELEVESWSMTLTKSLSGEANRFGQNSKFNLFFGDLCCWLQPFGPKGNKANREPTRTQLSLIILIQPKYMMSIPVFFNHRFH